MKKNMLITTAELKRIDRIRTLGIMGIGISLLGGMATAVFSYEFGRITFEMTVIKIFFSLLWFISLILMLHFTEKYKGKVSILHKLLNKIHSGEIRFVK